MFQARLCALALAAFCGAAVAAGDYITLPGGRFESVLPQGVVPTAVTPVDLPAFAMRRAPVTLAEYAAFLRSHPEWRRDLVAPVFADKRYLSDWITPLQPDPAAMPESPVVNVSWFAAGAYCESEGARLPSWLEWEYAAAADAARRDARADPAWRRRILSWYERPNSARIEAVGGAPNIYGLSNLHGLIWEWVEDFNALFIAGDSRTQGDPDLLKFCGAGAINIIDRDSYAVLMRIALLSSLNAADTTSSLGFRCVRPIAKATP